MLQSTDHDRMLFALKKTEKLVEKLKQDKQKEYLSYIKSFPLNIRKNGLGQALMMELAADNEQHKKIANITAEYLNKTDALTFVNKIIEQESQHEYRQQTYEAIELAGWLKKFAVAMMTIDDKQKESENAE